MTSTVLLVDDHPVVLRGLRDLIADQADLRVVGEARTVDAALTLARAVAPDVVVVPVRLEGAHRGAELCRSLKATTPARVVVFTSFTRPVDVDVALRAGADALVGKTAHEEAIVAALRRVCGRATADRAPVAPSPSRGHAELEPLTAREHEILRLVVEGLTNTGIAARLGIAVTTVKTHVRNVLRKLGAGSRRELLRDDDGEDLAG